MHATLESSPRLNGYNRISSAMPEDGFRVEVVSKNQGDFKALRFGHTWKVRFTTNQGDEWLSLKVKQNDWWRYTE